MSEPILTFVVDGDRYTMSPLDVFLCLITHGLWFLAVLYWNKQPAND